MQWYSKATIRMNNRPCCLLRERSRTPASLTRLRASSTRTHANGLHKWSVHAALSSIVSVLCILGSFHQKLPCETSTPSGEYTWTWTQCFHFILTASATTHPRILCFSLRPCRLGLLGFTSQALLTRLNLPRKLQPWKPWASGEVYDPIWLPGVPGCVQQAGSHPPSIA